MQEHFKVQRRIEEKNIVKEHWRPHNENRSQRKNTLNPNLDHSVTRGKDLRRGKHHGAECYLSMRWAVENLWGALKTRSFRAEIKSKYSGLVSMGWQFLPPRHIKDFSRHTLVGTGQANQPVWCWWGLASPRVLPSLPPSRAGGNHPASPSWSWRHLSSPCNHHLCVYIHGEKPTPWKGPRLGSQRSWG